MRLLYKKYVLIALICLSGAKCPTSGETELPVEITKPDMEKIDAQGFNPQGIHHITKTRYDTNGFSREGYNAEGYNHEGYNKDGFNQSGFNKAGYDENGFNKEGYNHLGLDRNGKAKPAPKADFEQYVNKDGQLASKWFLRKLDNLKAHGWKEPEPQLEKYIRATLSLYETLYNHTNEIVRSFESYVEVGKAYNLGDFGDTSGTSIIGYIERARNNPYSIEKLYLALHLSIDHGGYGYLPLFENPNLIGLSQYDYNNYTPLTAEKFETLKRVLKHGVQDGMFFLAKARQLIEAHPGMLSGFFESAFHVGFSCLPGRYQQMENWILTMNSISSPAALKGPIIEEFRISNGEYQKIGKVSQWYRRVLLARLAEKYPRLTYLTDKQISNTPEYQHEFTVDKCADWFIALMKPWVTAENLKRNMGHRAQPIDRLYTDKAYLSGLLDNIGVLY